MTIPDKRAQRNNKIDSRWAGGHLSTGRWGGSPGCWCWWCGTGRCRSVLAHHHFCWTSLECQHCLGEENKTKSNQTTNKSQVFTVSILFHHGWELLDWQHISGKGHLSPPPYKTDTSGHSGIIPALFQWLIITTQTHWLKIKRSKTTSASLCSSFAQSKKYQKAFLPALQPPSHLPFLREFFSENHSCEWSL